jgi:hypothetical protein
MDFAVAPGNPDSRLIGAVYHTWMHLGYKHKQIKRRRKMNQFLKMLKKDHAEVKGILGQLNLTRNCAPKTREASLQKLTEESTLQMKTDESTFYPSLLAKQGSREEQRGSLEQIIQQGI